MSTTNKVNINFHYDKIKEDFSIFQLHKDAKGKDKTRGISSSALDSLSFNALVSVQFTIGDSNALLLLRKGAEKDLYENIKTNPLCKNLAIRQVDPEFVDDRESVFGHNGRSLAQLFFNSLASYESEIYRRNNVTGKLLYHISSKSSGSQHIFIEVFLDKTNHLQLNVKTYTNEKYIVQDKKKTKYVFDKKTGDFRKALLEDEKKRRTLYVEKNPFGHNIVAYIDIKQIQNFTKSKLGILEQFLAEVEERLSPYIEISFVEKEDMQKYNMQKYDISLDSSLLKDKRKNIEIIQIVDTVQNQESERIALYIKKILNNIIESIQNEESKSTEIPSCIGKILINIHESKVTTGPVSPDAYNIRIIHNKEYYEKEKQPDPHKNLFENCVVQHVTIEDFTIDSKLEKETNPKKIKNDPHVKNILQEISIKEDILAGKIQTFQWDEFSKKKVWTFVTWEKLKDDEAENTENDRTPVIFYMIKVNPDGSFTCSSCLEMDFVSTNEEWEQVKDKYEELKSSKNTITFLQKYGNVIEGFFYTDINNICILSRTPEYIIPNIKSIKDELSRTNPNEEISKAEWIKAITEFKRNLENHPEKEEFSDAADSLLRSIKEIEAEYIKKKDIKAAIKRSSPKKNFVSELNNFLYIYCNMKINSDIRIKKKGVIYRYEDLSDLMYHTFVDDFGNNIIEYYVGIKSPLKLKVTKATPVRRICSKVPLSEDILSLMIVEFVRNGQYTVRPFPFKYIREYFALIHSANDSDPVN